MRRTSPHPLADDASKSAKTPISRAFRTDGSEAASLSVRRRPGLGFLITPRTNVSRENRSRTGCVSIVVARASALGGSERRIAASEERRRHLSCCARMQYPIHWRSGPSASRFLVFGRSESRNTEVKIFVADLQMTKCVVLGMRKSGLLWTTSFKLYLALLTSGLENPRLFARRDCIRAVGRYPKAFSLPFNEGELCVRGLCRRLRRRR